MKRIRGIIIRALAILAGFWLADLAAARIQAGIAAGRTAQQIMDDMTTMPRHPLMLGFDRTSLLCGLAGAAAVGLFLLYRWSMGQRNWRDGEEYGSARWSKPEEMAPYTDGDISENLQMTRTEGLSLDTRATRRNLNTTVLGGSGSGKTATHVIPNILKASMDYACTDPKGELYGMTHETLRRQGYEVRRLDLVDLTCETKFNPMQYIDPAKPDVSIMRLVTNIMDNTSGTVRKEHRTDDFWAKSERNLLTALIAFVYYLPDDILQDCLHIDAGQTLNSVADLRDLLESSEQDETRESPVDAVARTAMEIYEETRRSWQDETSDHDDPDLREAWQLAQGLCFAARQYRPFTQGAGETKKGIIISLGVRLAPLTVGAVREILSGDDIGIDRIGGYRDEHAGGYQHPAGKIAIFLALPDEDPTFNFLAAIFYQCLFDSIIRRCRTYPGERLATPLHCFLDEFANVGRIPNFDRLIATIRSRRVSVSVILQTIAQLKTMYRDSWETIVGNCDSVLFLGGNEQSTTEWLSKLLGKETIDLRTTSDSKGASGSHTINYQRAGRELLTPDELTQLDNDMCIYVLRGLHPFLSRKAWPGTTIPKPKSTLRHSEGWKSPHAR
ncbi:type IV secretory system conjugative DNA transfer family protein [Bifidobacterium dentium]|uniref:VirD4-like conjugal transfer protein, CD1115 family n=1 Tax=Bifidobacterium dentium TaxID=1689 RepID=UPI00254D7055|nr:type IV secretory system conjugative DNA transfer family protein [Bifidobacterium dentium]MDK7346016.1 type IV secretory system conjugative DNA transfer family protein [Bifidobacterium dentium]